MFILGHMIKCLSYIKILISTMWHMPDIVSKMFGKVQSLGSSYK